MKLNLATLAIILVGAVLFILNASGMPWTTTRIIGLSTAAPALLLLIVARLQLGGAFSVEAKATNLVTTGLYARIRNPIYVFGAVFIAGLIIWTGIPWLLLIFVILIPMQILRSRKEARVLEEKFGPAYVAWKQKTWF
ncbi:MAG: isoprenylcysteine carboxylmethyltransferase family protein [Terracidiphilus sp.]